MNCPPCTHNCNQGRTCPRRRFRPLRPDDKQTIKRLALQALKALAERRKQT